MRSRLPTDAQFDEACLGQTNLEEGEWSPADLAADSQLPFDLEPPGSRWTQRPWPTLVVHATYRLGSGARVAENWQEVVAPALEELVATLRRRLEASRQALGERELAMIKVRLLRLEEASPLTVRIETLAPEPYEVIRPFQVLVKPHDGEYLALFADAAISAMGETVEEAILNLKDMVVATFEAISAHQESELGPRPAQQIAVLRAFVRKTG